MLRLPTVAVISALVLAVSPARAATLVKIGGTGNPLEAIRAVAAAHMADHPGTTIEVLRSQGSLGGLRALRAGAIDLAVSAIPPPDDLASGLRAIPWARSPFLLAVAPETPVSGVTLAELADIYAGRRIVWADGSRLRVVVRPRKDTDNILLGALSPEMGAAVPLALERAGAAVAITDQDAARAIETVPGAIGSLGLCQILAEKRAIKPLTLDGVEPTLANLASGRYRHFKEFLLVVRDPPSQAVLDVVARLRSEAARPVLGALGLLQVRGP